MAESTGSDETLSERMHAAISYLADLSADLVKSGDNLDRNLDLAERVWSWIRELKQFNEAVDNAPSISEGNNVAVVPVKKDSARFDVHGGKVTLTGKSRKGVNKTWSHSATVDEFRNIVGIIRNKESPLDTEQLTKDTQLPDYKSKLVLRALVKLGCVRLPKKGVYESHEGTHFSYLNAGTIISDLQNL